MDVDIVNAILRLCFEQQTCLFEVPNLIDYCLEKHLCTNSKHVLASISNYLEIFKISRDRNRIEFFMPFDICRNCSYDGSWRTSSNSCPNLHVCYDYFYMNSCRRSMNCPYPHTLTITSHQAVLGTLIHLDLDALSKAFKVHCQSKRHFLTHNPASSVQFKGQTWSLPSSTVKNMPVSSALPSTLSHSSNPKTMSPINGNTCWKGSNRTKIPLLQQPITNSIPDKGLQICWSPPNDIQSHFVEVVFSNPNKSSGGPIQTYTFYQHLGISQIFYKDSEVADQVVKHGSVMFHSFTFTPRLLQRTIDMRHVCFTNVRIDTNRIPLYIDAVSKPYKKGRLEYYQNDQQTILVEYNEDIDFSKILSNVRSYPECDGLQVKCVQLYLPETLLIEYDDEYSENNIKKLFKHENIFHIKIYSFCAFVHFYSHDALIDSIKTSYNDTIRMTPIYIDAYSPQQLKDYLQRRNSEVQSRSPLTTQELLSIGRHSPLPVDSIHFVPILPSPVIVDEQTDSTSEVKSPPIDSDANQLESKSIGEILLESTFALQNDNIDIEQDDDGEYDENEIQASDHDFDDLPLDFDNDDLFLDESLFENGDAEYVRSFVKKMIRSLAMMQDASNEMDNSNEPKSSVYADDFVVTLKCRPFAVALLNYIELLIEKRSNPDRFRLLSALKKSISNNINQQDQAEQQQQESSSATTYSINSDLLTSTDTKPDKKKSNKRSRKKKHSNNKLKTKTNAATVEQTLESINDDVEHDIEDIQAHDDHEDHGKISSVRRLPDIYLDEALKPCILVSGEEHSHETQEFDEWHDVVAGGKQVAVTKIKKQSSHVSSLEQTFISKTSFITNSTSIQPFANQANSSIIPADCRGFLSNAKLQETFRLHLRRSFPSINMHLQPNIDLIIVDGNIKPNVQKCLNYLNSLKSYKRSMSMHYDEFPQTTITNVLRMQQSTAQVQLVSGADYNRIFRSTYRLIDYQLKNSYYQQRCIYCRRSQKQFRVTYLEFPCEKQSITEINEDIQKRIRKFLDLRFSYIAIALSADLMTTKRWSEFYKTMTNHKELNKSLLIRRINTIIQVFGLHACVQQIQTSLTKFLDTNRYETDVIESEQARGIYALFVNDFEEMKNLEIFREAELRFIYRCQPSVLLVQCFQEKLELVKSRIQNLRSQLFTVVLPINSPILSRYYTKSDEIQSIAAASSCIISIERRVDPSRPNEDLISLKIVGRSSEKTSMAQRLIAEFENSRYSTKVISNNAIDLFTKNQIEQLQNQCNTHNVLCQINQRKNSIELEGLIEDINRMEQNILDQCSTNAQPVIDCKEPSIQWIYYDTLTNKPMQYDSVMEQQLETYYSMKQKGMIKIKDQSGIFHTFSLDQMIEIKHENATNPSPINVRIERRAMTDPQSIQLPMHWTPMTKPWDRVLLAKRENIIEWSNNNEVQKLLQLPEMLPESWIIEIHRIQNVHMFRQYMIHKEKLMARSSDTERILYRLAQANLIDDMCANGFNQSHTDSAFSAYGQGCHYYCKAKDINLAATLLAKSQQTASSRIQTQTPIKPTERFLFVCRVLVGRCTRGDPSMKTCPPEYDSLVDNTTSPEIVVPSNDAQVLPEHLIVYQSGLF